MKTIIKGLMYHDPIQGTLVTKARIDRANSVTHNETVDLRLELSPYMNKPVVITIEDDE